MNQSSISSFFSALAILFCFSACHETNTQNTAAVREEMRSREIVHATPGQIAERAREMGDSLIQNLESNWKSLQSQFPDSGCSVLFLKAAKSVKDKYQADIQVINFSPQALSKAKTKVEKEIIDAYLYNREQHLPMDVNLQKDGDKEFLFTRAYIQKADLQPCSFSEVPSKVGDTLGIWSVRMQKRNVILSFVDKY